MAGRGDQLQVLIEPHGFRSGQLVLRFWSGIGIVAITLVGVLAYRQIPSGGQLLGMALITAGVVIVNLSGEAHG